MTSNDQVALLEQQLTEVEIVLEQFARRRIYNDEVHNLYTKERELQRALSLAKGEDTAVPIDYPYPWETGAPLPHVVSDGCKVFLIYYIGESNPKWTAQEHVIIDLNTKRSDITALVEFDHCYIYKFGGANDEVINGHPLAKHGLERYEAHIIENSSWLEEQVRINSIHRYFNQASWDGYKHYLFTFHDEMFECLAKGYRVDVFKGSISAVFEVASIRLFNQAMAQSHEC